MFDGFEHEGLWHNRRNVWGCCRYDPDGYPHKKRYGPFKLVNFQVEALSKTECVDLRMAVL